MTLPVSAQEGQEPIVGMLQGVEMKGVNCSSAIPHPYFEWSQLTCL